MGGNHKGAGFFTLIFVGVALTINLLFYLTFLLFLTSVLLFTRDIK